MVTPVDAMAMAIFMFEGARLCSPSVRNIRNNNPGNLRPWRADQVTDPDNYRTFPNFAEGWAALVGDIRVKLSSHLKPTDTMVQFFELYAPGEDHNNPHSYAQYVCKWMSEALGQTITVATPLQEVFGK